ncbi:carbonic anhydrase/acetyltransferase-like protein (isoleucine patch superfamily) [Advenella incenata]|jgi:carbonic anhydrase/acetyltransferase-like protein (isoleucine patch superfamily)|uniref:Carbonic anhydrase/acetyltransferase-like protein (Isoleucine patch superfamily) n=1 Tax=Advenella incenata TaxID=267800 RepID=A0A4Q7V8N7_9BURK|nr:gamma carbonic anhydrase family protein [Advenella incenata]RZT93056.1 carbonic anhydrase/acetyltransferase-like protein (isoleucine patch superfamily) [Advenella incenata]
MAVYQIDELAPNIDTTAFVFDSATVIGNVTLEKNVSVWANVAIRGDNAPILIQEGSNVQEGSVLHVDEGVPLTIEKNVTVGHQAMLHGCTVGEGSLIGMQAIVLNNARIGKNCIIGAGAIVTEGKVIPDGSLVIGIGKIARTLSEDEIANIHKNTAHYVWQGQRYRSGLKRLT